MALTKLQRRERQQEYNRRSRERKSRRAMLTAQGLMLAETVPDATLGRIVRLTAAQGDAGSSRVLAIAGDAAELCGVWLDSAAVGVVAAAHDY
jgi:hypothetical protein